MQMFTDANREIIGSFHVWYFEGNEIEAFRTQQAAEWAIRRAVKASGSDDYLLDKDGRFLLLGLPTGHTVKVETRDAIIGV